MGYMLGWTGIKKVKGFNIYKKLFCLFSRHDNQDPANCIYSSVNPITDKYDGAGHLFNICFECGEIYNNTQIAGRFERLE